MSRTRAGGGTSIPKPAGLCYDQADGGLQAEAGNLLAAPGILAAGEIRGTIPAGKPGFVAIEGDPLAEVVRLTERGAEVSRLARPA
jgi:hypothetical protein